MTLDYEEDAVFFKAIIEGLGSEIITIDDSKLIEYIVANKLGEINSALNENYWANFAAQKSEESKLKK